jgi:hypothetical protein
MVGPKHLWAKQVMTIRGSDGFFRRCRKGRSKRITKQKCGERRNAPQLSASGGFAGFSNESSEIFLIGFVVAFFVFLAAAAPASRVTAEIHG